MQLLRTALPSVVLAAAATAQFAVLTPPGIAALEGDSNNAFPWNRGASSMHAQFIHDSTQFTSQSVAVPVLINRLRYRRDASASTIAGGSWPQVRITLATCTSDYLAVSGTFAANLGGDATVVHNGQVTVTGGAGNGAGVPGPFYIDIPLSTPFLYNPTAGDLVVDIELTGAGWSGTSAQCDHVGAASPVPQLVTRIYDATTNTPNGPTGTIGTNYGPVCEFGYVPAANYAYATQYGTGCYDRAVSFYEQFPVPTFDLGSTTSTNTIMLVPTGGGYLALPGAPNWQAPSATAINLGLGDDAVSGGIPLPFTFTYPGGSTTNVIVESNGNLWLQPPTHASYICDTSPGALLSRASVLSACYVDLDPSSTGGGGVFYEFDASGNLVVTWNAIPIWLAAPPPVRATNTFQVVLGASGIVEIRYQGIDTTNSWTPCLVGFSPGNGSRNPGPIDISAALPFQTYADTAPLALSTTQRPRLGQQFTFDISRIPATSLGGFLVCGLTQHNPGIDLGPFGAPGCSQFASVDVFIQPLPFTGATASFTATVPNGASLRGLHAFAQAGAIDSTQNTLGVLTTNGLDLKLDVN